jgi:hypothetical protein
MAALNCLRQVVILTVRNTRLKLERESLFGQQEGVSMVFGMDREGRDA